MVDFLEDLSTCIKDEDEEGICRTLQRVPNLPDAVSAVQLVSAKIENLAAQRGYVHLLELLAHIGLDIAESKNLVSVGETGCWEPGWVLRQCLKNSLFVGT